MLKEDPPSRGDEPGGPLTPIPASRAEIEQALRKSEERFRRVVESAPNAMVMIGPAGLIEMVNAQAERMFGFSREEMLGQAIELLVPYEQGALLSRLHEVAGDLEREDTAEGVRVRARVPAALAERLRPYDLNGRNPQDDDGPRQD